MKKITLLFLTINKLLKLRSSIVSWNSFNKPGHLLQKPHWITLLVYWILLPLNPNNLGNWSIVSEKKLSGTRLIESKLIKLLINLYHGKKSAWEGYVTSGATEAIIFSFWALRNYLKKGKAAKKICVVGCDLTHYSIQKATDLLDLSYLKTKVSPQTWTMDVESLLDTINSLHKNNFDSVILVLTEGYTQTGTSDNIDLISQKILPIVKEKKINIVIMIDSALNGLVLPFSRPKYKPLANNLVFAYCADFHKTGMLPAGCGVVLYKKTLRKYFENQIPYLEENDSTLLGSRSAIPAVAAYFLLQTLDRTKMKNRATNLIQKKERVISMLNQLIPKAQIISDSDSLSFGIVTPTKIDQTILDKYGFYSKKQLFHFSNKNKHFYVYKGSILN